MMMIMMIMIKMMIMMMIMIMFGTDLAWTFYDGKWNPSWATKSPNDDGRKMGIFYHRAHVPQGGTC